MPITLHGRLVVFAVLAFAQHWARASSQVLPAEGVDEAVRNRLVALEAALLRKDADLQQTRAELAKERQRRTASSSGQTAW